MNNIRRQGKDIVGQPSVSEVFTLADSAIHGSKIFRKKSSKIKKSNSWIFHKPSTMQNLCEIKWCVVIPGCTCASTIPFYIRDLSIHGFSIRVWVFLKPVLCRYLGNWRNLAFTTTMRKFEKHYDNTRDIRMHESS